MTCSGMLLLINGITNEHPPGWPCSLGDACQAPEERAALLAEAATGVPRPYEAMPAFLAAHEGRREKPPMNLMSGDPGPLTARRDR